MLYSAARVLDAERFVCLDADMVVLGDLRPVFAALDASPEGSILAVREGNGPIFGDLDDALQRIYGGAAGDVRRLTGAGRGTGAYPLVVNDGLFAAKRAAMLTLDDTIRRWPEAPRWVDERADVSWRNQFVFNLALARLNCGVELDATWNLQLNYQDVRMRREGRRTGAVLAGGREVRVLHFSGAGKSKYPEWRGRVTQAPIRRPAPRTGHAAAPAVAGDRRPRWTGLGLDKVVAAVVVYDPARDHRDLAAACWEESYHGRVPLVVCHTLPGDRVASAAAPAGRA